jgi:transcriptional regulator with XRE-family HTH domain
MPNQTEQFQAMIAGLESAGLSRAEIARRAGLSRMTVWRLAEGEGREPLYRTVRAIEAVQQKFCPVNHVIQKRV